ncbi:TetR/AcrR family transcriptional regulator [Terricaulis sp.]|uniref:TetR/AcrR family transcriptional regulator n=1 Tax=Terricaulis sp. TaxID=2768686 RepID=UPI002AC7B818|nr:TetR/AcrR family transcriptional regulator [Terricaulis sp.]MDZ4691016.1 TetR/AcrR family transcriptional regulator [Terricaulis sp.]
MAAKADTTETDGRRLRADESRRRIAQAMLDLVLEGEVTPSAETVAERAGVGRRTVFRLFNDMEGVYREMHAIMVARLAPMFAAPFDGATWRERLDEVIERRARMFEEMLPIKSAADAHRYRSAFLQNEHKKLTRLQRQTMLAVLPEAVAAQTERVEALDLALSFEVWRRLRQEQRLPPRQAAAVLRRIVRALMG